MQSSPQSVLEYFHCHKKKPCTPWLLPPSSSILPALGNHYSALCLHIFAYWDILYNRSIWNVVFVMTSFSQCKVFKAHPCYSMDQYLTVFMTEKHFVVLFYLSIHQLVDIGLFLPFGYYEECCCEYLHTSFCVNVYFHLSWVYTQEWNCWMLW